MNFIINGPLIGLAKLLKITGGHSILDMELTGYSVEKAYAVLGALGDAGRAFYLKMIPLDFVFPFSYGLFYFITLTLIAKNLLPKMNRPWLWGMVGILATIFDWLENIMVIQLLHHYPERLLYVVSIASIFTQIKALFIFSSIGFIVIGLCSIGMMKLGIVKGERFKKQS